MEEWIKKSKVVEKQLENMLHTEWYRLPRKIWGVVGAAF